ncbi:MAG: tyrosine-type recombinase/integrase [Verrucomicrobiae bacterium]|nr:tyrosine-type recombinase/integrase [Verrucomicrobiae bacterium]
MIIAAEIQAQPKKREDLPYLPVCDGRHRQIRGLCARGNVFYARMAVEVTPGKKVVKRFRLEGVSTPAQAKAELERLRMERRQNTLPVTPSRAPLFQDFVKEYLATPTDKRPTTMDAERKIFNLWIPYMGNVPLHKITKSHITQFIADGQRRGLKNTTTNLNLKAIRVLFRMAVDRGYLRSSPTDGIRTLKIVRPARPLVPLERINLFCDTARRICKNGQAFSDYVYMLCWSGVRRSEGLRLKWQDVDFQHKNLIVGADGQTKNGSSRVVYMNEQLERHLRDMYSRCQDESVFLFPSHRGGKEDHPLKMFEATLKIVRKACGMRAFSFHELRHFFISQCVMSKIDFLTIARWVGHRDGGVLIGRTYGHISDEHARQQAANVTFDH